MPRPRLLPLALVGMVALLGVKLGGLFQGSRPSVALVSPALASAPAPPAATAAPAPPAPDAVAERAVLEALRARRTEIEAREAALAQREILVAAVERRLTGRLDELAALQQRLEAEARSRDERTEQGWRQMVRLYEGMRPRDAAGIFDDLDMPVLIQVVDRMREAKAAPVLAAMRTERARLVTTELARHRSRRDD
ncbi:MotE family protein [Roseococcus sp.]|uniref:MotE family protein n=1 Tax=Roseococcus sp. TaxID=2109646 RepID=UPI003BA945B0